MPKVIAFLKYMPVEIDGSSPGGKIKLYRYEHGLSQKKLARLIGIDPSTLTRIETGQCSAKSKVLQKTLVYIKDKENH